MSVAPAAKAPPWTEAQMKRALWQHFTTQGWAVLEEFTTTDTDTTKDWRSDRRIDVLAIRPAKRLDIGPIELLAIEVKVSRSDFLSDVRRPEKQAPWRELAHRHAYAVPAGLVTEGEVPAESGLIEVTRHGPANQFMGARTGVTESTSAQWARLIRIRPNHKPALTGKFVSRIAFRAASAEATQRGYAWGTDMTAAEARAETQRTRSELEKVRNQLSDAKDARDQWRLFGLAATPSETCSACGELIRPASFSRHRGFRWRHADKALDGPCLEQRLITDRYARRVEPAEFDLPELPVSGTSG